MKSSRRLDYVDGLRGLACLYVAIYHLFLLWPVSSHLFPGSGRLLDALTRFAAYGHIGVDIFLAVSGFCLFYPLCTRAASTPGAIPAVRIGDYAKRRARRILPPYLVAVVLFSVLPFWPVWADAVQPVPTLAELASHLTLTQNLFPSTILRIDGPLWSLALEAQLYVLFPLLSFAFWRMGALRFLLLVTGLSATFRIIAWNTFGVDAAPLETQFVVMASVPGRACEFALGMLAAYIVSRRGDRQPRLTQSMVTFSIAAAAFALAYLSDKRFGEHSPLPSLLWGAGACALLVAGNHPLPLVGRVLAWRPFVLMGTVSYSMYLLHEPLLRWSGRLVEQLALDPMVALGLALVAMIPLLFGLAAGFWVVLERPFMRSGAAARPTPTANLGSHSQPVAVGALASVAAPPSPPA